jgi:predicted ATPase
VLAAVGSHLTNAQIASRLHLSVRTVDSHVASLLRKLGVADRRALADLAPAVGGGPTLGAGIVGLPEVWTSLVGREGEVGTVEAALDQARLVTLVGPGGVGKTRLAVEVARAVGPSFPFGVGYVELVPVQPDFVVQAVATTLGAVGQPGRTVEQSVHGHLARRRVLVVLDNCEHVLAVAATFVANLLAACSQVSVLATSRERLGVAGERVIAVNPLSTDGASVSDAVRLFVERAREQDPSFADEGETVARLCVRLDGLPLAIELAAARVASVGTRALLDATTDRLRLLAGGQGRHRSLRAVLDWSHDLLGEPEQRLLRRLGAFANAFDLAAVVTVAGDGGDPAAVVDPLGHLVDKNLVTRRRSVDGPTRWQLLETVRSYALDRLQASGEAGETQRRHRSWAASVAADLARRLDGRDPWTDEFDHVVDDLRAALELAPPGPDPMCYELARATGTLAFARGLIAEAERHLRVAAAHAPTPGGAAAALKAAAHVAMNDVRAANAMHLLGDAADAVAGSDDALRATCLAQAIMIAQRFTGGLDEAIPVQQLRELLEDIRSLPVLADPPASAWRAQAEAWMATGYTNDADLGLAEAAFANARSVDDPTLICVTTDAVSSALLNRGRYREAYEVDLARLEVIGRLRGHDPQAAYEIDDAIETVGHSGCAAGELRAALAAQGAAIDAYDVERPHRPVRCAVRFPFSLALTGRFDEASITAESMWSGWLAAGSPFAGWMGASLLGAALAHGLRGHTEAYQEWLRRAAGLFPDGDMWERRNTGTVAAFTVARVAFHAGELEEAASVMARYIDHPPPIPPGALSYFDGYPRALAADIAAAAASPDARGLIDAAAPAAAENRWARACVDRARGRLHHDPDLLENAAHAFAAIDASFEQACTLLLLPRHSARARRLLTELSCPPPA